MTTLDAQLRDKSENLDYLRKEGMLPAVFYGKKTESTPVKISTKDFIKVWNSVGESGVISLVTPKGKVDVLIHSVDSDPTKDLPIHVDFYVFEKGKKVDVSVPLEFVGTSPAVKDLGCNLVKVLHEINIFVDPQNIPHSISVDIGVLVEPDSHILAKDIKLPSGVELLEEEDAVIAIAEVQREQVEEESSPVDLSSIEVEKKGKKEEEVEA